jgi:predicted secreted protein
MSQKITGKAAYLQIAGTKIGMTKLGIKTDRKTADSTDTLNYDVTSDLIWPEQLPVMAPLELTLEGRYNLTTTPANVINALYTGALAVACVIGLSSTVIYGHGNFDITGFDADAPLDDIITFTLSLKSNGLFVFGS